MNHVLIVWFAVLGAVAGADGGWIGAFYGAAIMCVVFGPVYVYGLWMAYKSRNRE